MSSSEPRPVDFPDRESFQLAWYTWRAINRDGLLNKEEASAYLDGLDAAMAARHRVQVKPRPKPAEQLAKHLPVLHRAGWTTTLTEDGDYRALIDGFLDDAAVMVTYTVGSRRRIRFYVLRATASGRSPWLAVAEPAFQHFLRHRALPAGEPAVLPDSKCRCRKFRHATERRAMDILLSARARKELGIEPSRREKRAYRCPADARVWHLTSQAVWRLPQSAAVNDVP